MGGGSVMRSAAARVTGLGVILGNKGLPSSSVSLADRVVSPRNSVIVNNNSELMMVGNHHQRPCWEINDWDFVTDANDVERVVSESVMGSASKESVMGSASKESVVMEGSRKVVALDDVPSLDEAKEATDDLKMALEKLYQSADAGLTEKAQNTANAIMESQHALQAFSLLRNNPEVQNVVVSLVADKNIWEAMMKNEQVNQFYKNMNNNSNLATFKVGDNRSCFNESDDGDLFGNALDGLASLVKTLNVRVVEMLTKLAEFIQQIVSAAEGSISRFSGFNVLSTTGPTLVALTIASIMVVMLKRV